jgi:iron complex outermembrane recepter protein
MSHFANTTRGGLRARLMDGVRVAGMAGFSLAAASGAALAQEAPAPAADEEMIIVTGSRIPQPNLVSTSPIQVVDGEEFKLQGTFEASNLLNNTPQNFIASAIDFSNTPNPLSGPGGTTNANLRGLGPQRTLVLVDGVRLGVGDAHSGNPNPAPDLDQIPGQLVERVEVVTGGASAVYGSDAVAGVINFIMRDDFEGVQIDGAYGWAQHNNDLDHIQDIVAAAGLPTPDESVTDGENRDLSVILGANTADGAGNITAYVTYHRQDPVSQANRDFSGCLLASTGTDFVCANSSNSNIFINANTGDAFGVLGDQFVPWGTPGTNPPSRFNSSPFQYLSRDDTRYSAGYLAHYDVNEALSFYSTLNFMDDRTNTEVGPTALFQQNGVIEVNCDNPLLSAQQAASVCTPAQITNGDNAQLVIGRRNVEGGPRHSFYEHESYRFVVGARGDLSPVWSYDLYTQYYRASLSQVYQGDFDKSRIRRALQVVDVAGTPTCKSDVDGSDTLCVPWNIFEDGGVTPEALAYIAAPAVATGTSEQSVVSGNLAGDLSDYGIRFPWAEDGVAVAIGAEYRHEQSDYMPDSLWQSGNLTGTGGAVPAASGAYDVREIFSEVRVPIVQNAPFAYEIALDAGYRYSDYSNAGGADTYKVGLQWAPTEDVRFRASVQRAVRAPNLTELFVPLYVTNSAILTTDPCAPNPDTGVADATLAQCMNTGVTAAQYGDGGATNTLLACPAGQCSVQQGGNPNLSPESADTFSVGLTFTPSFLPGFTASIDYYRIKVEDVVGVVPITTAFNRCLIDGDPTYCSRIQRTPQGYLFGDSIAGGGWVLTPLENLAVLDNTGVDVQAAYSRSLGDMGDLSLNFAGAYVQNAKVQTEAIAPTYDCAGLFGPTCAAITPNWRHTMRVTWDTPWAVRLSANWRHIGEAKLDANSDEPVIGVGLGDEINGTLDAADYLDFAGSWDVTETTVLRFSVNNVLDESPQVISGGDTSGVGGPNTYPTYDLLGRVFSIGFTQNF